MVEEFGSYGIVVVAQCNRCDYQVMELLGSDVSKVTHGKAFRFGCPRCKREITVGLTPKELGF